MVADPDYLNRMLHNLVNNSAQAMPTVGKMTLIALKDDNDIVIKVQDTGVGSPEELKDKMFTPMFTTKAKGQGFGLPVVKRMTEALGGTVSFESQGGKEQHSQFDCLKRKKTNPLRPSGFLKSFKIFKIFIKYTLFRFWK